MADWLMRATAIAVHPGAWHLPGWLGPDRQRALVARCLALGDEDAGFYQPVVRGGGKMRVRMLCLGRHWNALTYRYEDVRSDVDGRPVPPIPVDIRAAAGGVAEALGVDFAPDICLVNLYGPDGRMGLHQDKDESPESIAAGVPIVSLSIGDTAKFMLGGFRRKDEVRTLLLESGDAFVLAGPSRLRYHGVRGIVPGTAPPGLGFEGRLNLTFRQY